MIQRFANAYRAAGITAISRGALGDTAWVVGTPPDSGGRAAVARVRVVAFWRGDSTLYRDYVAARIDGPAVIGTCAAMGSAAAIPGRTPREPTGEETLPVWQRGR